MPAWPTTRTRIWTSAGGRYDWVARMVAAAVVQPRRGVIGVTDRIDKVATHPSGAAGAHRGVRHHVLGHVRGGQSGGPRSQRSGVRGPLHLAPRPPQLAPAWLSGVLVGGWWPGPALCSPSWPILVVFSPLSGCWRTWATWPAPRTSWTATCTGWAAWQILYAAAAGVRLQRAGHPGDADHRGSQARLLT